MTMFNQYLILIDRYSPEVDAELQQKDAIAPMSDPNGLGRRSKWIISYLHGLLHRAGCKTNDPLLPRNNTRLTFLPCSPVVLSPPANWI